jgi:hypothetical protein
MADEKDRFGETMKLVERAKEEIYFAGRDRELIEKLKHELKKVEKASSELHCLKCPAIWRLTPFRDSCWSAARAAAGSGWIRENLKGSFEP